MFDLLKDVYAQSEELYGKKLLFTVVFLFIAFTFLGLFLGYFNDRLLNNYEVGIYEPDVTDTTPKERFYEGKVVYVDPKNYPDQDISYYLADDQGNVIILLQSSDDKLLLAEALNVKVYGEKVRPINGKEVLRVEKVVLSNYK